MALLVAEAASIVARYPCMRGIDPTIVVDCFFYRLLLYKSFDSSTAGLVWLAHAPNYWICDGILQGNTAQEIGNALLPEIDFEYDPYFLHHQYSRMKKAWDLPFFLVKDDQEDDGDDGDNVVYGKRPYRWISITLKNNEKVDKDMQTMLARASSIFLAFETKGRGRPPLGLPNGLLTHCSNLGVLVLSRCAFSFVSPPFIHCHTLRFLGLDRCSTDDDKADELTEGKGYCTTKWECLQTLCVIDLYYTDCVDILLSEEKIELMASLMELNIEGARCSQLLTSRLQERLPCLQRLRIIKPMYDEAAEATSSSMSSSLAMDKTNLEILDLSGNNRGMGSLPASISKVNHLQVLILDGCDGLGDVVLSNSSLRSFSFDGYRPAASHRTSTAELPLKISRPRRRPAADKNDVKTTVISLAGCRQLDNLFLRGLPNLVELDLSRCAIKVLDFENMVVDVPRLKRLFLLGCKRLRTIRWGSDEKQSKLLELLCVDTRPAGRVLGCAARPSLGTLPRSLGLQVHAIIVDARLIRSLFAPIANAYVRHDVCFSINITSSTTACSGLVVQPDEATASETMETTDQQPHHAVAGLLYGDIFTKVGDGLTSVEQAFPQPPSRQLDCHVEIGDGRHAVQSEEAAETYGDNLTSLLTKCTQSLHVHDVSNCSNTMPTGEKIWLSLRWCRVERCPDLHAVFPRNTIENGTLEILWISDLLNARCIWSKVARSWNDSNLQRLQHLHLRSCPSLQFAVPVCRRPSLPSLETLHIIHCGNLVQVFELQEKQTSVQFPKLTTIHLHNLPALRQICEAPELPAPALETIKIRGCWSLRRLPALKGREPGMRRPTVEMEKDVWDALEWNGVDAGHHPSLYEAPVHSREAPAQAHRSQVKSF